MRFWFRFAFLALAALLGAVLSGCAPGQDQADDEKEPHFVLGKSRLNAMDYPGAAEAFEEALEADPRLAKAHLELGGLYEDQVPDPAAAIYHYERYLKLDPNAGDADLIKQHIFGCKQKLAADVLGLPSSSAAQEQLEKLVEQNQELQQRVNQLQDAVKQWSDYYASQLAARSNEPPAPNPAPQPGPAQAASDLPAPSSGTAGTAQANPPPARTTRPRTHTVVAGDTAVGIARRYGLKLSALEEANPGMNPARIRVGQVLNLPP